MLKIDLHTHSDASPDGGITIEQYIRAIDHQLLDFIAVTDHNTISRAQELQKALGKKIIVGEEIMTAQGELIGLFLEKAIKPGKSALETAHEIREQGGIVYLPHPFETVRKGISELTLEEIAKYVQIVEVYNGRAFAQNRGPQATTWARLNGRACAASSDAHGSKGLGTAYTVIKEEPTAKNLSSLILHGHCRMERPPLRTLLYPQLNRLRKAVWKR
jgi:hypothetical protein